MRELHNVSGGRASRFLRAATVFIAAGLPQVVLAQGAGHGDQQALGQRLFMTSCGICHEAPDLANKAPGPALSQATLNGNTQDIADFIKTGTQTMPSFKYSYSDAEIDAIAHYIVSLPTPKATQ